MAPEATSLNIFRASQRNMKLQERLQGPLWVRREERPGKPFSGQVEPEVCSGLGLGVHAGYTFEHSLTSAGRSFWEGSLIYQSSLSFSQSWFLPPQPKILPHHLAGQPPATQTLLLPCGMAGFCGAETESYSSLCQTCGSMDSSEDWYLGSNPILASKSSSAF